MDVNWLENFVVQTNKVINQALSAGIKFKFEKNIFFRF